MNSLWRKVRVDDEHLIRPELIALARDRVFQEATKQLILCDRGECGKCDDSCLEAKQFIIGIGDDVKKTNEA